MFSSREEERCMRLTEFQLLSFVREKKKVFSSMFFSLSPSRFLCGCAQDAFDSIHKTPIENYRPNCIFIREKQTEKPANQWRKVCAFFFHSLLLSCSTFLLFISLRLSSLVWHSIVFFVCSVCRQLTVHWDCCCCWCKEPQRSMDMVVDSCCVCGGDN